MFTGNGITMKAFFVLSMHNMVIGYFELFYASWKCKGGRSKTCFCADLDIVSRLVVVLGR